MTLQPPPDRLAPDSRAYRQALGAFATGVCVVTADSDDGPLGITINSFTSVSLEPRLILWCLEERSTRWPVFAATERFALHVLAADQQALSRRFAKGVAALSSGEIVAGHAGPPRLNGALAWFDCAVHDRIQMGDHMIIVGRVEAYEAHAGAALGFFRGRYSKVTEQG